MAVFNVELRKSNGTDYKDVIHIKTNKFLVEGLLGADDKIKTELLPAFVLGGMKYVGTISSATTTDNLITQISDWLTNNGITATGENYVGKYFVATKKVVITRSTGSEFEQSVEGADGGSLTLHSGDWIIYNSYNGAGPTIFHNWGVVNNTYANATEGAAGVIQLSTKAQATTATNDSTAMTPLKVAQHVTAKLGAYTTTSDLNKNYASKDDLNLKLNVTDISDWAKKDDLDLSDIPTISVAKGGTGATTATVARTNLGLGALATKSALAEGDIPALSQIKITGLTAALASKLNVTDISDWAKKDDLDLSDIPTISVAKGGTGATTATVARTNLGLGALATKSALAEGDIPALSQIKITGLTAALASKLNVTDISDWAKKDDLDLSDIPTISVAKGGTGATTATVARTNLGLGSVSNYGIAAKTDAQAGTSDKLYMTPLKVKQAIDTFASIPVMAKAPGETGGIAFVAADNPDGKLIMVSI